MTRELDDRLKQMFAELDEDLPAAGFTSEVMSVLRKPHRHRRWLWSSAVLAALACAWLSFPILLAGASGIAGLPHAVLDVLSDSLARLQRSPIAFVYGVALGGYMLLWLGRRLRIRAM